MLNSISSKKLLLGRSLALLTILLLCRGVLVGRVVEPGLPPLALVFGVVLAVFVFTDSAGEGVDDMMSVP